MSDAKLITSNQFAPSSCEIRNINACSTQAMASPPSFASRMIRLIFKRKQRCEDQRPKSWPGPGYSKPAPVPVPTATRRQPSATIAIPSCLATSAPSKVPTVYTRLEHAHKRLTDDSSGKASWRQRQTCCANCGGLFFKTMSMLSSAAGRFCSLDCKANLEYLTQIEEAMDVEMLGINAASSRVLYVGDSSFTDEAPSF
ncbi:hypothetical protein F441_09159 [Phytophthora nicotianae CJ01A1]|uniref:FLZ-type domain-containing protein n=2 Tax=Phytophthora nicotianae TaxID=4792 RepID=W2X0B8_PHYNI|nr:hypothetical protein L915_09026 [Phytophthora nicotianae]ETP16215.1 hypothetical protein F441_09159 [Phytophthora nicotianae CJ01A1]